MVAIGQDLSGLLGWVDAAIQIIELIQLDLGFFEPAVWGAQCCIDALSLACGVLVHPVDFLVAVKQFSLKHITSHKAAGWRVRRSGSGRRTGLQRGCFWIPPWFDHFSVIRSGDSKEDQPISCPVPDFVVDERGTVVAIQPRDLTGDCCCRSVQASRKCAPGRC